MTTLTEHQQEAFNKLLSFVSDPNIKIGVLEGFSGTGKTFMVRKLVDELPQYNKAMRLINPSYKELEVRLTATTNKAAEALETSSKLPVVTVHSALNMRVHRDFKTGETSLRQSKDFVPLKNTLLIVDEMSFPDDDLIDMIEKSICKNSKIIYIGDPAQLVGFNSDSAPAFNRGYPTAKLTEVVRQKEGNQIQEVGEMFRDGVTTGNFRPFIPNGVDILHVDHTEFQRLFIDDMSSPNWLHSDSRILAWRNKTVTHYNDIVATAIKGTREIMPGDYVINNHFVLQGKNSIATDKVVRVVDVIPENRHGYPGKLYMLEGYSIGFFCPNNFADIKGAAKHYRNRGDYHTAIDIDNTWADFRPVYASTIDKSQGSTFKRVYVDLNDVGASKWRWKNMFRLLYVGCTRPSEQLILTGDI